MLTWESYTGTIDGSSLMGDINVDYNVLVEVFGAPIICDGYKSQVEWRVLFNDGTIARIHDWKEYGVPVEDIVEWSVGGYNKKAVNNVLKAISMDRSHTS